MQFGILRKCLLSLEKLSFLLQPSGNDEEKQIEAENESQTATGFLLMEEQLEKARKDITVRLICILHNDPVYA